MSRSAVRVAPGLPGGARSNEEPAGDTLQAALLAGVSRTFALCIPQLPGELRAAVGNAYLLCRIVDTIEDEAVLAAARKREFSLRFPQVVSGQEDAALFARELVPLLSERTPAAERELLVLAPSIVQRTRLLSPAYRASIEDCVRKMAAGMARFQERGDAAGTRAHLGLRDQAEMDRYCYFVAGVVGEMLTGMFCEYSPRIARARERLMSLAVSFGQGLQMVNILKDIWDDHARGACWLPREVFEARGFDLDQLAPGRYRPPFGEALHSLIDSAYRHLEDALAYTLCIPASEGGIRRFCTYPLGFAVLTLRRLKAHPDFASGCEVKIPRWNVRVTVLTLRCLSGSDTFLRTGMRMLGRGLSAGCERKAGSLEAR